MTRNVWPGIRRGNPRNLYRSITGVVFCVTLTLATASGADLATRALTSYCAGAAAVQPALNSTQPSLAQPSKNGFLDIQGAMKSPGEQWVLPFFDAARAKTDEKIVERICRVSKLRVYRDFDDAGSHDNESIQPVLLCENQWIRDRAS